MKTIRLVTATCAALITIMAGSVPAGPAGAAVRAGDWPQFMGGRYHQGWNPVEYRLTPASAPALRPAWTEPIETSSYAPNSGSPVIVDSTVVVGGPAVTARDVATGRLLWARELRGSVITTPAWAGRTIVVAEVPDAYGEESFTGVAAMDAATGVVRWERRVAGAGLTSPTVAGGSVLIGYDTGVARLRLADGRLMWRTDLPGRVSSPTADGTRVFVGDTGGTGLTALNLRTGQRLWRRVGGTEGYTVDGFAPALLGGVLFAPLDGITALDARTGSVRWRGERGTTFPWGLATDGRRVIGVSNDAHVVAVAARTGRPLWSADLHGVVRAAAIAGGVAFFGSQSRTGANQIDLIDVATGAPLGEIALPGFGDDLTYTPMPVAVSRGRVAVADWEYLVLLGPPPGDSTISPLSRRVRGTAEMPAGSIP
ncbi:MAG TPA: PQQ-binding-like beta-propeller repeat protein [Micromonosporaceae bacterium]|nr:PQQ-binding-like beta-propeller repeat protein [Micromonosporaceae bacterium]